MPCDAPYVPSPAKLAVTAWLPLASDGVTLHVASPLASVSAVHVSVPAKWNATAAAGMGAPPPSRRTANRVAGSATGPLPLLTVSVVGIGSIVKVTALPPLLSEV